MAMEPFIRAQGQFLKFKLKYIELEEKQENLITLFDIVFGISNINSVLILQKSQ